MLLLLCWPLLTEAQSIPRYGVVITEIFADPSPSIGMPASEFIEIRNLQSDSIELGGWVLTDGNSRAIIPAGTGLAAGGILILCNRAAQPEYARYGIAVGLAGFPSLDNDGDLVSLVSSGGALLHAVQYRVQWHDNSLKQEGGWSLEMKDPGMACSGADNWASSRDPAGGTPGKANSVHSALPAASMPRLLGTFPTDSLRLIAYFDQGLDSAQAADPAHYFLDGGVGQPRQVIVQNPLLTAVELHLTQPLERGQLYQLRVEDLAGCSGVVHRFTQTAKAALPQPAMPGDLRINELLFNPGPGETDYVELLHTGSFAIDLSKVYLGNLDQGGLPSSMEPVSGQQHLMFPGEFRVVTGDTAALHRRFPDLDPLQLFVRKDMPSYPDDAGTVCLTDQQGQSLETVTYRDDWHFALMTNRENVALERIRPEGPVNDPGNWQSAAASRNYGTPTRPNSQFMAPSSSTRTFSMQPAIVSPDLDGHNDQLLIRYHFPEPGFVCSIQLYDASGRFLQFLVQQALCGREGSFTWDGLSPQKSRLPAGLYMLVCDAFHLQGKRLREKQAIVLAYR